MKTWWFLVLGLLLVSQLAGAGEILKTGQKVLYRPDSSYYRIGKINSVSSTGTRARIHWENEDDSLPDLSEYKTEHLYPEIAGLRSKHSKIVLCKNQDKKPQAAFVHSQFQTFAEISWISEDGYYSPRQLVKSKSIVGEEVERLEDGNGEIIQYDPVGTTFLGYYTQGEVRYLFSNRYADVSWKNEDPKSPIPNRVIEFSRIYYDPQ